MEKNLGDWDVVLQREFSEPYFHTLKKFLEQERKQHSVFPSESQVFEAFRLTPFSKTKIVLIGQDPYHGFGQAHGLSFSVKKGIDLPPSLKNIEKELKRDLKIPPFQHGCLEEWAKQGVLLLNAVLTVREKEPNSHQKKGWEQFTNAVIEKIIEKDSPVIFLLLGKKAQEKVSLIKNRQTKHLFFEAAHPSPFSAHLFLGCGIFSNVNKVLESLGEQPIDWRVL